MKRLAVTTFFIFLTLTLTAGEKSMEKPDIKLNPHPKMRYEIMLTIRDAPGPFESVTAFAYYETNSECVPEQAISGARLNVRTDIPVDLKPAGENSYRGTVYMDLLKDEDYYGLGVCRWKLISFNAPMKAGEVTFGPAIMGDEISSEKLKTQFFPKSYFGDSSVIKDTHTGGLPMSEPVARAPGKFFSTTLIAEENFE